ncbi:MAG TPA: TatD family hydrolase [Candidatus Bathyarchaeia archaeon]|nr:TatD family hydrolase [Candidatus Bathyarchaeia archaeon]
MLVTLIDTHCHLNMMVKKEFDRPLTAQEYDHIAPILVQAAEKKVTHIVNVGTSIIESENCISIAQKYRTVVATVGIHPNDCTDTWKKDMEQLKKWMRNKEQLNIVGIGECGLDRHYKDHDIQRQYDAFRAQIDLALEHDVALVVHSRDAYDETLRVLEEYRHEKLRGILHCFSYDVSFARAVIQQHFVIGIGSPVTYPKNDLLRSVAVTIPLESIVLETDAPFLPPQHMRGKQNHPQEIMTVAVTLASLRSATVEEIARQTTATAATLFKISL